MKHGEPWKSYKAADRSGSVRFQIETECRGFVGESSKEWYVERIVACVNACAGLENVGGLGSVAKLVSAAKKLVENSCDDYPSHCDGCVDSEYCLTLGLRSALAAVEKARSGE